MTKRLKVILCEIQNKKTNQGENKKFTNSKTARKQWAFKGEKNLHLYLKKNGVDYKSSGK